MMGTMRKANLAAPTKTSKETDMDSKDNTTPSGAPQSTGGSAHCNYQGRQHRRGGRLFMVLLMALAVGVAGGYIGRSLANVGSLTGGIISLANASENADPQRMGGHIDRAVKHFASKIDATPAQQEKLAAIAKDAMKEIGPVRNSLHTARQQAIELTRAPVIDRVAIEKLRAEQIQLADRVSKRMTQALADAAEVLTPEQRQKITGRMAQHMDHGHGHRGHDGDRGEHHGESGGQHQGGHHGEAGGQHQGEHHGEHRGDRDHG